MPWESPVLDIFRAVPENPSRYDFHAPYNKLLFYVFPMEDHYTVAPDWNASSSQLSYFRFDIFYKKIPVLILELKGPGDLQYPSKRQESVQQIQRRLKELRRQYSAIFFFHTMPVLTASLGHYYSCVHPA
jgi:hypothetical protein